MIKRTITIALAIVSTVAFAGPDQSANAKKWIPQLVVSVDQNRIARSKLLALGNSAIPVLVNSMASRDEMIRSQCADLLAIMGTKTIPALSQAIHSPEWRVRASACLALGSMTPNKRATDLLVVALKDDDWWVRSLAATNLSGTHDRDARVALREMTNDPDERVVARANQALEATSTVAIRGR